MAWLILHIDSDQAHCEAIESALLENGAASVTLQDSADQALFEPAPGETPLWQQVRISGLYDADSAIERIVESLQSRPELAIARHQVEILEDKDWVRSWMDSYQPMAMGRRLWICPSWLQPPDPGAVNLVLDPGLAFGTGTHPTTAMCLRWLDRQDPGGNSVIDYGCGSGILAIAALLLGAASAVATDIDPQAIAASQANAERNRVNDQRLTLCYPADMAATGPVDILLANILAGPLSDLAPQISPLVRPGGRIVLSGILSAQAAAVMAAYPQFEFSNPVSEDGWVLLEGTRA